jgi:hypothetical protein
MLNDHVIPGVVFPSEEKIDPFPIMKGLQFNPMDGPSAVGYGCILPLQRDGERLIGVKNILHRRGVDGFQSLVNVMHNQRKFGGNKIQALLIFNLSENYTV